MSRFKRIISVFLILTLVTPLLPMGKADASVNISVTESAIYWEITSKAATSSIRYKTIGWTVHLNDESGDPMKSGVKRVHFMGTDVEEYKSDSIGGGYVKTFFKIDKEKVSKGLAQNGMEDVKHNETIHLSAIMNVADENGNKISGPYYKLEDAKNAASWSNPNDLNVYWDIPVPFDSASNYPANVILKTDDGNLLNKKKKGDYRAGEAVSHTFLENMSINGSSYEIVRSYISPTLTGEKKYILESTDSKVLNRNAGVSVGGIDFIAEYKQKVVEPPSPADDGTPTAFIYLPNYVVEPNVDVGYKDQSFATDGETITYRELTITDQNGTEVGNYVNELSPSISFSTEGDYTFDLIVFSGNGKMDTDTKTITVQEDSAIVNPVLDISVPPMYETLYYSQEDFDNNKVTELRVFFNAEDSSSTNGIDRHYWYIEGDLVDATGDDPTYSQIIPFSPSDPSMSGAVQVVDSKTGDRAKAYDSLTINFEVQGPPIAVINSPVVAIEEQPVDILNESYIPGGDSSNITIVEWTITPTTGFDGALTGDSNTLTFHEIREYQVDLYVETNTGQSDSTSALIEVREDIPDASFTWSGHNKENRKVVFDATPSTGPGTKVVHDLNKWEFIPQDGQDPNNIKIVASPNYQFREALFKETGDYLVRLQVENEIGKVSEWYENTITIGPDVAPVADFEVIGSITRDPNNNNIATVPIQDRSQSLDNDVINRRVWYYRYDSNNDGIFTDENRELFSDGNVTNPSFTATEVGRYEIILEAYEDFGQPTIEAFILPGDRLSQDTKNKPSSEKVITVINIAPTVEWGQ